MVIHRIDKPRLNIKLKPSLLKQSPFFSTTQITRTSQNFTFKPFITTKENQFLFLNEALTKIAKQNTFSTIPAERNIDSSTPFYTPNIFESTPRSMSPSKNITSIINEVKILPVVHRGMY